MGRHRSRSLSSSSSYVHAIRLKNFSLSHLFSLRCWFNRGRGIQSSSWDGKSGYRVHVSDLAAGVSKKEVERVFRKFGTINEVRCFLSNQKIFSFNRWKWNFSIDHWRFGLQRILHVSPSSITSIDLMHKKLLKKSTESKLKSLWMYRTKERSRSLNSDR